MSWKGGVLKTRLKKWNCSVLLGWSLLGSSEFKEWKWVHIFLLSFSGKDKSVEAQIWIINVLIPTEREVLHCLFGLFVLVQLDLFCFSKAFRKRQDGRYVHGCWVFRVIPFWLQNSSSHAAPWTSSQGELVLIPERALTSEGEVSSLLAELKVVTNKFILIEYVNELRSLLSAELAKYIREEMSVLPVPSRLILNP